jgi:hypothetical protein
MEPRPRGLRSFRSNVHTLTGVGRLRNAHARLNVAHANVIKARFSVSISSGASYGSGAGG